MILSCSIKCVRLNRYNVGGKYGKWHCSYRLIIIYLWYSLHIGLRFDPNWCPFQSWFNIHYFSLHWSNFILISYEWLDKNQSQDSDNLRRHIIMLVYSPMDFLNYFYHLPHLVFRSNNYKYFKITSTAIVDVRPAINSYPILYVTLKILQRCMSFKYLLHSEKAF